MASMRRSAIVSCMSLGIVDHPPGWGLFGSSVLFSSSPDMVSEEGTQSRDACWPCRHSLNLSFSLLSLCSSLSEQIHTQK